MKPFKKSIDAASLQHVTILFHNKNLSTVYNVRHIDSDTEQVLKSKKWARTIALLTRALSTQQACEGQRRLQASLVHSFVILNVSSFMATTLHSFYYLWSHYLFQYVLIKEMWFDPELKRPRAPVYSVWVVCGSPTQQEGWQPGV